MSSSDSTVSLSRESAIGASVLVGLLALLHCILIFVSYRRALRNPKGLNNALGVRLQWCAPVYLAFVVFLSLAEIGTIAWLMIQFHANSNSPEGLAVAGLFILVFAACLTWAIASAETFALMHPSWMRHPIASLGGQIVWIFVSWAIWIGGTALVNHALPILTMGGNCVGLVYCSQLQAMFGIAVVQVIALTIGLLVLMAKAWWSTGASHRLSITNI